MKLFHGYRTGPKGVRLQDLSEMFNSMDQEIKDAFKTNLLALLGKNAREENHVSVEVDGLVIRFHDFTISIERLIPTTMLDRIYVQSCGCEHEEEMERYYDNYHSQPVLVEPEVNDWEDQLDDPSPSDYTFKIDGNLPF
jgi:hypothetical protein